MAELNQSNIDLNWCTVIKHNLFYRPKERSIEYSFDLLVMHHIILQLLQASSQLNLRGVILQVHLCLFFK